MRILVLLNTLMCVFILNIEMKSQSKNDLKIDYHNRATDVQVNSSEIIQSETQNFRLFSSRNSEVLFDDKNNQCKIFRSFFTEYQDDIFLIKQNIKSGMFYEVDDLNNTFTTTEKIVISGTKFIEMVTYKSDKKHIKLIKMLVPDQKLKEFKPLYDKYLDDYLN
jgi:hypothetical protein